MRMWGKLRKSCEEERKRWGERNNPHKEKEGKGGRGKRREGVRERGTETLRSSPT